MRRLPRDQHVNITKDVCKKSPPLYGAGSAAIPTTMISTTMIEGNTVWGPRAGIIVKVVKIVKIGKSRQVLTTGKILSDRLI